MRRIEQVFRGWKMLLLVSSGSAWGPHVPCTVHSVSGVQEKTARGPRIYLRVAFVSFFRYVPADEGASSPPSNLGSVGRVSHILMIMSP